jgi:predicted dehydrogenase
MNRRTLLKASVASTLAAPAIVRGRNLNSTLQMASIGTEGKGWSDTLMMSTHAKARHIAFCDIDLARTAQAKDLQSKAPVFQFYRDMLDKLEGKIDAITVSTPDHMHAYIALDAMRRGIHVHCQKPLTHNVWEARQMRLQAAKSKVITRMGNQIHSHKHYRTGVKIIQDGLIGKVKSVQSWCNATGHGKSGHINRPESASVPKTLDWDKWIGVAPMRPFVDGRVYHPWGWRDWQDFGNGCLGDFGCHILDPVFTALDINKPPGTIVCTDHTGINDEVWPAQNTVLYNFPGTRFTAGKNLDITWLDGGRRGSSRGTHIPREIGLPTSGSLFHGTEGTLVLPHVSAPRLYPQEKFKGKVKEESNLDHYHGFIEGCISGKQPSDGFDYAGPLTEAVLLGNIAVRHRDQKLTWNADKMKLTSPGGDRSKWLRRDYRDGWDIQAV